ncbi:hypothetical protein [Streptomyces sp. NPDC126503]|uniref:hypothetical protein n=1 Tax=Streptomyces sp. NPDC126503 TaxID=3155315 RepID=UPI00331677EB
MFEIRIICDPSETDRITTTLGAAFTTGAVRQAPTRDRTRARLYVTAEHTPEPEWPTPEQAYTGAPSIARETRWCSEHVDHPDYDGEGDREFWIRWAALLDRHALNARARGRRSPTEADAEHVARHLMDIDGATVICDPRHYVRQQYHRWLTHP